MTLGEGSGILGQFRAWRNDRPNVKIVLFLRDYGSPPNFVATTLRDVVVDIEVHSTGGQPVHVREVGMEFGDHREHLGRIDATLTRPEFRTVHCHLSYIRPRAGTRLMTAIYVTAAPEREFRLKAPKSWRRFPSELPPVLPGR